MRKRARRDVELASARGVARLARELLPSLDNLDRALAAAEAEESDAEHHLTKGIRLVQQELLTALTRVGIEQFSPVGEAFDPHQHEAVAQHARRGRGDRRRSRRSTSPATATRRRSCGRPRSWWPA